MQELPHIRYLLVVGEVYRQGRIGAAADAVNLSQPAATQSLARIEDVLGTKLFDRHPGGMIPTEAGIVFKPRLFRLIRQLQTGEELARRKAVRNKSNRPHSSFHKFCSPVHVRSLLAIARTGSYNQAARELGVSQPGVHRAMRDLAAISGITLFEQTRGGVVLTPAAEAFVFHLRLAVREFQQSVYEINEFLGRDSTVINVGSMPLSRSAILPGAIDTLFSEYATGVQVNCVDARYDVLLRDLRFGELDFLIGALRFPSPASDVVQQELFVDDLAIVVAPHHPLAGQQDITLEDTLGYPWVAPPRSSPSGSYLFDQLRINERAETPVRVISSSLGLLRGLLARGDYVSIASRRQIEVETHLQQLVTLPIALPGSDRSIGLTFRSEWVPTPVQKRFLEIVQMKAIQSEGTSSTSAINNKIK